MPEPSTQARAYFSLPCCARCLTQPCEQLRFGGVHPGKFLLVPRSRERGDISGCPFEVTSSAEVRLLLDQEPLLRVVRFVEEISDSLPMALRLQYRQDHFVTSYADIAGRLRFLQTLWGAGAFFILAVPEWYSRDQNLRAWLLAYESWMPQREEKKEEQQAAASDEVEETPTETVQLTNPRWEHADEMRKEKSPDAATGGDKVRLAVDVTGIPEGAEVIFDIYDTTQDPPQRIATVKGSNEGGTARALWNLGDSGSPVTSVVVQVPTPLPKEGFSFSLRGTNSEKTIDLAQAVTRGNRAEITFDDLDPAETYRLELSQPDADPVILRDAIGSPGAALDFSKLAFEASARSKVAQRRDISLDRSGLTSLKLRVPVKEGDAASFTLRDASGAFELTKDLSPGGDPAELLFDDLDPNQRYTLAAESGEGGICEIFTGTTLSEVGSA